MQHYRDSQKISPVMIETIGKRKKKKDNNNFNEKEWNNFKDKIKDGKELNQVIKKVKANMKSIHRTIN